MDERILAQRAHPSPTHQEYQGTEERNCFYCLEGWVFLGSLDHDGEEIVEVIRCRRCGAGRGPRAANTSIRQRRGSNSGPHLCWGILAPGARP